MKRKFLSLTLIGLCLTNMYAKENIKKTKINNKKDKEFLVALDKSFKIKNYSYKKDGLTWNYIKKHEKDFKIFTDIINKNYKLNLNINDFCISYKDCLAKHPIKSFFDFKLEKRTLNFMFLIRYMANDNITYTKFKKGKIAGTRMTFPGVLLAARWKRYIQNHAYYKFLTDAMRTDIYKYLLVKYKGNIPGKKIEELNNYIYAIKQRLWYEENEIVYKLNRKTGFEMLKNSGLAPKNLKLNSKEAKIFLMKMKLLIKKSIPIGGDIVLRFKNLNYYENLKLSYNWTKLLNNVFNDYREVFGPKFEFDEKTKTKIYVAYLPFFDKFEDAVVANPDSLKKLLKTRKQQFWYDKQFLSLISFPFYHKKGVLLVRNYFKKKLDEFKKELDGNKKLTEKEKNTIFNKYKFLVTEYNNYDITMIISSWGAIIGELNKFTNKKWYKKVKPLYNEFVY